MQIEKTAAARAAGGLASNLPETRRPGLASAHGRRPFNCRLAELGRRAQHVQMGPSISRSSAGSSSSTGRRFRASQPAVQAAPRQVDDFGWISRAHIFSRRRKHLQEARRQTDEGLAETIRFRRVFFRMAIAILLIHLRAFICRQQHDLSKHRFDTGEYYFSVFSAELLLTNRGVCTYPRVSCRSCCRSGCRTLCPAFHLGERPGNQVRGPVRRWKTGEKMVSGEGSTAGSWEPAASRSRSRRSAVRGQTGRVQGGRRWTGDD